MFPIWSDINICFGLLLSIMISLAFGFAIFAFEIRIRMTGWFFIISCRLIVMSRRLAYRNCLEHSKLMQTPIFVLFSETQISSHLFEISLKLTIICYINLIKSITIIKKWMDKYFLHCDFSQNEPSFRNKSQWSSDSQDISYQFLNTGLSAWNIIPASSHNSDLAPQTP